MPRRDPESAEFTRARIRQVFDESGQTMQAFATAAGLSTAAISRILAGVRSASRDSVDRIAQLIGRSPSWFYPPVPGTTDLDLLMGDLEPETADALRAVQEDPVRLALLRKMVQAMVVALAEESP